MPPAHEAGVGAVWTAGLVNGAPLESHRNQILGAAADFGRKTTAKSVESSDGIIKI